ncbi:MAG: tRNA (adenine-N1)-methyltransferase, partial [Ilumatobacteraceae bacterium]|nr:tRNA (adenine-N1)-methyltransferase [Ilumatobacteraceae bacterium]
MSAAFVEGDRVLLIDTKERRYLVTLEATGEFHSHAGFVPHTQVIGSSEGCTVESTKGARYVVMRPTLEDFVLEMPRGAQVIYPKDLAPIAMLADIAPGHLVFESGVGSGALSMTMLRAGARIIGYELREDFAQRAKKNVASFLGDEASARFHVMIRDSYAGIDLPNGGR